jgi:hypothetical protein
LDKELIIVIGYGKATEIQRVNSRGEIGQGHQILPVGADIHRVMVDGALIAIHIPLQRICGDRAGEGQAVIDARFNFGSLFIIVPGHELKVGKRLSRAVHAVQLGEGLKPGLAALLSHDAIRSPGSQRIVEAFVSGAHRLLGRIRQAGIVETRQIPHPIVSSRWHYPRITAVSKQVGESVVVLEDIGGFRAQLPGRCVPVYGRI